MHRHALTADKIALYQVCDMLLWRFKRRWLRRPA